MSLSVNDGTGSQTFSGDDGTGSQNLSRSGTQRLSRSGTMSLEKEASSLLESFHLSRFWRKLSRRGLTHAVRRISRSLTPSPQSIEDGVKKLERRPSKARCHLGGLPAEASSRNLTPPGPVLLGSAPDKKPEAEEGDEEWDPYDDTESNVGGSSMNLGVPGMDLEIHSVPRSFWRKKVSQQRMEGRPQSSCMVRLALFSSFSVCKGLPRSVQTLRRRRERASFPFSFLFSPPQPGTAPHRPATA